MYCPNLSKTGSFEKSKNLYILVCLTFFVSDVFFLCSFCMSPILIYIVQNVSKAWTGTVHVQGFKNRISNDKPDGCCYSFLTNMYRASSELFSYSLMVENTDRTRQENTSKKLKENKTYKTILIFSVHVFLWVFSLFFQLKHEYKGKI